MVLLHARGYVVRLHPNKQGADAGEAVTVRALTWQCGCGRQAREVVRTTDPERLVAAALQVLEQQARLTSALTSPQAVRDYFRLTLGRMEREEFWGAFLDAQHRVIAFERLFIGTLTQCSVHPREI